ncbi:PREDICTED: interleukin-36 alpha isoform X1 [Bison bison bison]|uniref:Interleukin-1 n=2 Tax=Bovinae TaxID=27592 RepID=A0A6P3GLI2_BISBB|nr:PREDICTED: interleukin-36 alpha isoform X1 [Bison bison bison]XP_014331935.1 PREDICTED: interleukin-36 alpha isoform X1 [Bos mutus]
MSSHLGRSETPSSKGDGKVKGPGEDVHGRAKKLERGDIQYPAAHICLLIFSTVLSRIHPILVNIQDINHLVWVLQGQTLTAVPRKDQMDPVTVTLVSCKYTETLEKGRGNPVYLGLKEPELCLFCTKVKGQPTLQLQERNIMDLYHQTEPVKPFLFYHDQNGRASSFESVAFPGWFIGSCSCGGCPVIITQELGEIYTTDFGFTVLQP